MLVYATESDLADSPWDVTNPPANVDRLLARASRMVRGATRTAIYAVDTTGMPADQAVVDGFRDAVCAQVSTWISAGITNPGAVLASGGSSGVVASKSLGPRSVSYAGAEQAVAERVRLAGQLTDEAAGILDDLGLWHQPLVIG